jgi:hypothetical protein
MDILDRAINGSIALSLSGTTSTLTTSDGALSDGQYKLLVLGGTPSGTHTITIAPNDAQKIYFVRNTTAQSVVFTQGSGGNVTVATGDSAIIYSDGAGAGAAVVNITNDFAMSSVKITGGTIDGTVIGGTSAAAGTFTTVTASGDLTIADKIVHSGDTNTSIRFPAADTVTVETSGTERVRVDSTGNVGIGVTAPTSKLNVVGDQIVVSGTSGTAGLGLQLKGTPIDAIPAAQTQGYIATGNSGIGTAGDLLIAPRTDTTASIRFVVGTTPTERMRVDASGNVYFGNGVNVASPANSFLLATNGSGTDIAGASMTIQAGRGTGAGAGGALAFNTAAAGTTGTTLNAATERMRINTAGNVGIGTSSPAYKLVVSAAGASGIEFGPAYSGTANLIQHYSRSGGVYVDAVNDAAQHRFATSGTERMRIDSSGNVGIATTSPAGLLEVFDVLTVPARNTLTVANKRGLSIYNNQSAGAVDTTLAYGNTVNSYLAFGHHNGTTYAERMRIDAVGNVGIGIAAPIEKLDVRGAIFVGNVASGINYDGMILDYNTSTREARLAVGATSGGSSFFTFTTSNGGVEGERMRIDSAGNVGIGTTSPQARLSVSDASAIGFEVAPNFTGGIVRQIAYNRSTSAFVPMRTQASQHEFYSATGEVVRIDSSGNVGIGTNAPAQRLHVVGQARIVGSVSSGRLDIFGATSATDGAFSLNSAATRSFVIRDEYSAAERMRIDSAGNVGIGTTSPTATLTVLGTNNAAGGIALTSSTSDATIKVARIKMQHYTNAEEPVTLILGSADSGSNSVQIGGGSGVENAATGIQFFTAANTTTTTGTERMRIDSAGNVGLGTNSPAQRLHVKGVSGSPAIQVETSNGTNNSTQPVLTVGTDTLTYQAQIALVREGTSGLLGWSFLTNAVGSPTERLRITSAGNVGISTTAPSGALDVSSGLYAIVMGADSGATTRTDATSKLGRFGAYHYTNAEEPVCLILSSAEATNNVVSIGGGTSNMNTATQLRFFTAANSTTLTGTERMRITAAGNVVLGNGETAAAPASTTLLATGASGTDIAGASMTIQGGRGTGTGAGGSLIFSTAAAGTTGTTLNAATERMRISSGGVVSIGTTNGTPASSNVVGVAASVSGYISASRDNTSAEFNRIASDGEVVAFLRAGTKVGSISVTTTATAYNTSSDYRLKESIQPIFGASDRVRQLNPVNFAWKADGTRTDGFIAHEVQAVAPQAVTGEKDGEEMQAIDHSKLVPLLTAALQEALTEIALLKARLDAANI